MSALERQTAVLGRRAQQVFSYTHHHLKDIRAVLNYSILTVLLYQYGHVHSSASSVSESDLALGVWDAQRTLMDSSQQSRHGEAVSAHSLRRVLQVIDALGAALQERRELVRQSYGDAAQTPGRSQTRSHARVQQH